MSCRTNFGLHDSLMGIIMSTQSEINNFDGSILGLGQKEKILVSKPIQTKPTSKPNQTGQDKKQQSPTKHCFLGHKTLFFG
jgi:hypothetical protein